MIKNKQKPQLSNQSHNRPAQDTSFRTESGLRNVLVSCHPFTYAWNHYRTSIMTPQVLYFNNKTAILFNALLLMRRLLPHRKKRRPTWLGSLVKDVFFMKVEFFSCWKYGIFYYNLFYGGKIVRWRRKYNIFCEKRESNVSISSTVIIFYSFCQIIPYLWYSIVP